MKTESISIFTQNDQGRAGQGKQAEERGIHSLSFFASFPDAHPPLTAARLQSSEKRSTEAEVYNLKLTSTCQLTNLRESVKKYEKKWGKRKKEARERRKCAKYDKQPHLFLAKKRKAIFTLISRAWLPFGSAGGTNRI